MENKVVADTQPSPSTAEANNNEALVEEELARGQKRPLQETIDDDDDDDEQPQNVLPPGIQVTWNGDTAIVTFECIKGEDQHRLCMVGRAKLKCLEGSVQVLGHVLTPSDEGGITVTSPYWSSWMTVQASTTILSRLQLASIRGNPISFRLVPPTRPIVIPPSWKTTVDQLVQGFSQSTTPYSTRDSLEEDTTYQHPKQQVVLCGAKGVGKSTLLRYLTNRLLLPENNIHEIAILDADVGQPELAPPGVLQLSIQRIPLLQPPYWNLCSPVESLASVFFGAVTSKVDPTRYIEGVEALLQKYRDHVAKSPTPIPLILNMDGWVKGFGYQVLTALITNLEPSHVCQILGETKGKIFDLSHVINPDTTKLFFLDACTKHVATPVSIPPSTLRTLRLGTYFGPHLVELWDALDFLPAKRLQTGWVDPECTLAQYLARERPYCVPFEAVQFYFLGADRQDVHSEERILQALNGSIVALCTSTSTKNSESAPSTDCCLGLGLVRSIDWRRRLFFLLTPVPPTDLPRVTALVGGNLPLPTSFVFRGVAAESFPYLSMKVVKSNGAMGTEPMKSRNNIARRGNIAGPPNGK